MLDAGKRSCEPRDRASVVLRHDASRAARPLARTRRPHAATAARVTQSRAQATLPGSRGTSIGPQGSCESAPAKRNRYWYLWTTGSTRHRLPASPYPTRRPAVAVRSPAMGFAPGLARLGRACPGHPRRDIAANDEESRDGSAWMPGARPGMTRCGALQPFGFPNSPRTTRDQRRSARDLPHLGQRPFGTDGAHPAVLREPERVGSALDPPRAEIVLQPREAPSRTQAGRRAASRLGRRPLARDKQQERAPRPRNAMVRRPVVPAQPRSGACRHQAFPWRPAPI